MVYVGNDNAAVLERTLASLDTASDLLVIDDTGKEDTLRLTHRYRGRVKKAIPGVTPGAFAMDSFYPWILVLQPGEALNDDLRRSLEEWKKRKCDDNSGYTLGIMQENDGKWQTRAPQLRLVNRRQINWTGELPPNASAPMLPGSVLRYAEPEMAERAS